MRPADLAEAAELLADAFVEDTNLASFVPARGRRERAARTTRQYSSLAALPKAAAAANPKTA